MINLSEKELQTLQTICINWAEPFVVAANTNELLTTALNIKNKMLKEAPNMSLADLQDNMSSSEFIGQLVNRINDELVKEEKLVKELREKFVKNLG